MSNYINKLKSSVNKNGKGDNSRITNYRSYWESDYFKNLEKNNKKEKANEK